MSEPNVRRTVTQMPRFSNISINACMRWRELRCCFLPATAFTGIKFTWHNMPCKRCANSCAHASLSFTPSIIAYSNDMRRPVASTYSRQAANKSAIGQRRFTGIVRERIASFGACNDTDKVKGMFSLLNRRMPSTNPQVDKEICRIPICTPPFSCNMRRNESTCS